MSNLFDIFKQRNVILYGNAKMDLDNYYPDSYQDEHDEIQGMEEPFETDKSKKKRKIELLDLPISNFAYFMDGTRKTYKIGDIVINGKAIFPVIVAQVRAGSTHRNNDGKLEKHLIKSKNLMLITGSLNDIDFLEIKNRLLKTSLAKKLNLDIITYKFNKEQDITPTNSAIGKANSIMHDHEIEILSEMVHSNLLSTNQMLIVDGPLQFLKQDTRKSQFADLFYNVVGVSKHFDPMMPTTGRSRRGGRQIGAELLKLNCGERTPVFRKKNANGREFGCWYLRIRPQDKVLNPLDGIIKVEKMATVDDKNGINTAVVDNLSMSLLFESNPTCHGRDIRWPSHLYPIYLTEKLIKSTFDSDVAFVSHFKRDFR